MSPHGFDPPIIGASPAMDRLRELVLTLMGSDVSVLITGESGVGKEVLARNLHRFSLRRAKPFVALNCAALAPGTLESELFGHDRGAFTGAIRPHAGLFEQADRGTLFLDEIGEIPTYVQAKLLRVLQEGEVRRMGEAATRCVDVRLISATNARLDEMVSQGTFRKDLFYRLNVVEARIPPLRQHADDVFDLIDAFFRRRGTSPPQVDSETRDMLGRYDWPGNVRELENELERLIALHGAIRCVTPDMFSSRVAHAGLNAPFDDVILYEAPLAVAVRHLEQNRLRRTLVETNWNKAKSARYLGLSRQGLLKKIKRYGISRESSGMTVEEAS